MAKKRFKETVGDIIKIDFDVDIHTYARVINGGFLLSMILGLQKTYQI